MIIFILKLCPIWKGKIENIDNSYFVFESAWLALNVWSKEKYEAAQVFKCK